MPERGAGMFGGLRYVDRLMTVASLTMYTTSWCGYCFRLKTALKAEGIPTPRSTSKPIPPLRNS